MDARLEVGPAGADLVVSGGDLARDDGLVTAVVLALLSDGLAPANPALPLLEQDLRGYWAEDPGDSYGSLLWTLGREKAIPATAARARELALDALAWMTEQGVASSVEVAAGYRAPGALQLTATLVRGTSRRWASLWDATEAAALSTDGLLLQVQVA